MTKVFVSNETALRRISFAFVFLAPSSFCQQPGLDGRQCCKRRWTTTGLPALIYISKKVKIWQRESLSMAKFLWKKNVKIILQFFNQNKFNDSKLIWYTLQIIQQWKGLVCWFIFLKRSFQIQSEWQPWTTTTPSYPL